jgi:hypothetical protein
MDINALFPSDYLKAADIVQPRVMTIRAIKLEEIGQDKTHKPVLFFNEETRGLVMNKTNGAMIAHNYSNETDSWLGKPVELHVEPVQFQGRVVDAIRVRIPTPAAQTVQPAQAQPAEAAAPVAAAPVQTAPAANAPEALFNDDVDF